MLLHVRELAWVRPSSQPCALTSVGGPWGAEPVGGVSCSGAEPEEAEYAWLPIHCLKPFEPGDAAKHAGLREGGAGGALGGEDANLSACVGAAERALAGILAQHAQRMADNDEADSAAESDSDGGAALESLHTGPARIGHCVGFCCI